MFQVPFLDTQALDCLPRGKCQDPKCRENFLNMNKLGEKYNTPDGSPGNLHVPFTLDQSYYLSLTDSTYRDKDQVVAKYADRRKNKNKSLLMVNQMWVWKIDASKCYLYRSSSWIRGYLIVFW